MLRRSLACKFLCGCVFSFLLGRYLGVELLGRCYVSHFEEPPDCSLLFYRVITVSRGLCQDLGKEHSCEIAGVTVVFAYNKSPFRQPENVILQSKAFFLWPIFPFFLLTSILIVLFVCLFWGEVFLYHPCLWSQVTDTEGLLQEENQTTGYESTIGRRNAHRPILSLSLALYSPGGF